jgi:hypothetical protein
MPFRLIFALSLSVAVLYGLSPASWAAYYPPPERVPYWYGIVGTFIAIVVALGLYAIRCFWPFWYGLLETLAALCIIFFSIAPAKANMTVCNDDVLCFFQSLLITLAGIYILVRGMDNMQVSRRVRDQLQFWRQKVCD